MLRIQNLIVKNMASQEILLRLLRRCIAAAIVTILLNTGQQASGQSRLSGFVRDVQQKPICNSTVILANLVDSIEVTRVTANETGLYIFEDVAIGDYFIKATAVGFEEQTSPMYNVISSEDDIQVVTITLPFKSEIILTNLPFRIIRRLEKLSGTRPTNSPRFFEFTYISSFVNDKLKERTLRRERSGERLY